MYVYNHNENSVEQKIFEVLDGLKDSVEGIKGVALASSDGLPIATTFLTEINKDLICAMAATLYNTGTRVGNMLNLKNFKNTTVELEDGFILVSSVKNMVLLAFMDLGSNLGLAKLELPKTCNKIEKILF